MLAVSGETEAMGNNGESSMLDHQISLPEKEDDDSIAGESPSLAPELIKQNSIFSLTLGEIQCKSGRSFGSMNMEDFIASIYSVEENGELNVSSSPDNQFPDRLHDEKADNNCDEDGDREKGLSRLGSFSIPIPMCKKTVDEIWFEMHKDEPEKSEISRAKQLAPQSEQTLGEMTLEDFLVKAGIVQPSSPKQGDEKPVESRLVGMSGGCAAFEAYNVYGQPDGVDVQQRHEVGSYMDGDFCPGVEKRDGDLTETSAGKSRRRIVDGPPEVVIERRRRRMIKNRESAARSRARKQAYTVELEVELNQLKEENEHLKKVMADTELKRKQEVLNRRKQQSSKLGNLRTIRRATSLAW